MEELELKMVPEKWDDEYARKIVQGDIDFASADKTKNVDPKIQQGDELYISNPKIRKWDGTNILRASVNIHLVYEQINAIAPQIASALFSDPSNFAVDPRPGTDVSQAIAVKNLIQMYVEDLSDDSYEGLREIIINQLMDACIYGNGVIEFGWEEKTVNKCVYERVTVPTIHNINGIMAVGDPVTHVVKREVPVKISRPFVRNVNIKQFFIDPNCQSHLVQKAAYAYVDEYMEIDDLEAYRNSPGFRLPPPEELRKLAKNKSGSNADNDQQMADALRSVSSNPQQDQSIDPAKSRVRVIRYQQRDRCVWLIKAPQKANDVVIYNERNKYNCISFLNICYSPIRNKFWGMSVSELLRSDQKVIEDLINNRLDEENLAMHAPLIKPRGVSMPSSMMRIAPGRVWEGAKDDYSRVDMGSPNPITFEETNQVYARVEKKLGASSLSVLGTAAPGGNSANRTARGIAVQSAATGIRMMFLVENVEGMVLVPLYSSILAMHQRFSDPAQPIQLVGAEIDPLDILNASVKFRIKAASKMKAQMSVQQNLPMLMEMGLNPALIDMLNKQQNLTPDMRQWMELFCDAMDIPFRALYRDMTPEEQQAASAPTPDQQLRSEMQTQRLEHQSESQVASDDAALTGKVADKLLSNPAIQEAITGVKNPEPKPTKGGKK